MNTTKTEIKLTKILESEIEEVASTASAVYKRIIGGDHFTFIKNNIDTTHSIVARDGTEIIGGYILNEDVPFYGREEIFRNKKGIHGFALFLKEEYRNTGIGHELRKYPETLGFDYIFGLAYKSLNNANHWRKFGRYVEETHYMNFSYKFFKVDVPSSDILSYFEIQNKSYNCGASALQAILNFFKQGNDYSQEDIETIANTNPDTGTTHDGVENVVQVTKQKAFRNIFKEEKAYSYLDGLLSGHNFFLLRGLTENKIKHWYVVYSKNEDLTYNLLDPSNGRVTMSKDEIDKIWKPREYDGFGFYR
jgi:GNAT superfamily N-acetyltransferase